MLARGIKPVFSWPLNPQQNGAAEATMKHINRAVQNAAAEGTNIIAALEDRIQAHNSAVHSETGAIPSKVMFHRRLRTGLPLLRPAEVSIDAEEMRRKDWGSKMKHKKAEDKRRRAKSPDIEPGDTVVLQRENKRKGETIYDPTELRVKTRRQGDLVLTTNDGTEVRRDITKAKRMPARPADARSPSPAPGNLDPNGQAKVTLNAGAGSGEQRRNPGTKTKRAKQKPGRFRDFTLNQVSVGPLIID